MTKTICVCDLCGKTLKESDENKYAVLAYRTTDSMEGYPLKEPYIERVTLDLCYDCALRSTNIYSFGCMGGKYKLKSNKWLESEVDI